MHDGGIILIKEGQLVTGRKRLSAATGIPESTIEDILKLLEKEHQIQQQKTNKYRLVTILNWKEHQNPTALPTSGQQQADTYKNDKKEKNILAVAKPPAFETVPSFEEEERPKRETRTNDKETIYRLFSEKEQPWWRHKQQKIAALSLFDLIGVEKVQAGLQKMRENIDDPYCPQASTPFDYEVKLPKLSAYAKRNR
jgi:hypothetical protein